MVTTIHKSQIDTNQDDWISESEWNDWFNKHSYDSDEQFKIVEGYDSKTELYSGKLDQLTSKLKNAEFANSSEAVGPEAAKANAELNKLAPQLKALQEKIEEMQKDGLDQKMIAEKQKQLQAMIEQANALIKKGAKPIDLTPYNKAAGSSKPMSGSANINFGGQQGFAGKAQTAAKSQGATGGFSPPANWGAQTLGNVSSFNTDAYMKSLSLQDNIMSSWDSINKNTNRGKQLMMLFFYFARMAESGDMTAMYQFMKFITYIISKDKAKQQIEMGKKLIELQELSRSWTNKLLNLSTDSSDPSASNELMKTMTIVKSETDAIATSQKLISQMMEEFAQVVETLTNTTKAALETAGRIMRTVSTMR